MTGNYKAHTRALSYRAPHKVPYAQEALYPHGYDSYFNRKGLPCHFYLPVPVSV